MKIPKEYLGAFKAGHRPATRQFIDDEFANKLLERVISSKGKDLEAVKALQWLTKFNNEFHKNVIKKGDKNALHQEQQSSEVKTKKWGDVVTDANGKPVYLTQRETLYRRENAKNQDIMNKESYSMMSVEDIKNKYQHKYSDTGTSSGLDWETVPGEAPHNYEDKFIEAIDNKDEWESFIQHLLSLDDKALAKLIRSKKKVSKNAKKKVKKQA